MKKRHSLDKAEWSETREQLYQKDCEDILLNNGQVLLFDDNKVYLKSGEEKALLMHVDKPKSMWYEIWLKLKYG
jgi:hypothetical protein